MTSNVQKETYQTKRPTQRLSKARIIRERSTMRSTYKPKMELQFGNDEPEFTSLDHETWREFYRKHENTMGQNQSLIHTYYLENAPILRLFKNKIPSLRDIIKVLEPLGWSAQYVHGYHPPWKVFRMLHHRIMPLSASIRPAHEVGFAREPDIIHDIFGHLPSLLHRDYRNLLQKWSQLAAKQPLSAIDKTLYHLNKTIVQNHAQDHEIEALKRVARDLSNLEHVRLSPLQMVDKLYFWIFEFGVLYGADGPKVLGAGLLSSLDELTSINKDYKLSLTHPTGLKAGKKELFHELTLSTLCRPYSISDAQGSYATGSSIASFERLIHETTLFITSDKKQKLHISSPITKNSTGGTYSYV